MVSPRRKLHCPLRSEPITLIQGVTEDPYDYTKNTVKLWSSSFINQSTQTTCKPLFSCRFA